MRDAMIFASTLRSGRQNGIKKYTVSQETMRCELF